jgi:hypothetical protein
MVGHLTSESNQARTHRMCVILTRAGISLRFKPQIAPLSSGREKPALPKMRRVTARAINMTKETTPLWVWLSVALLAIGTLAYFTMVYLVEYVTGFS